MTPVSDMFYEGKCLNMAHTTVLLMPTSDAANPPSAGLISYSFVAYAAGDPANVTACINAGWWTRIVCLRVRLSIFTLLAKEGHYFALSSGVVYYIDSTNVRLHQGVQTARKITPAFALVQGLFVVPLCRHPPTSEGSVVEYLTVEVSVERPVHIFLDRVRSSLK